MITISDYKHDYFDGLHHEVEFNHSREDCKPIDLKLTIAKGNCKKVIYLSCWNCLSDKFYYHGDKKLKIVVDY